MAGVALQDCFASLREGLTPGLLLLGQCCREPALLPPPVPGAVLSSLSSPPDAYLLLPPSSGRRPAHYSQASIPRTSLTPDVAPSVD